MHFVQEEPKSGVLGSHGTVDFIQADAMDSVGRVPLDGESAHQPSPCGLGIFQGPRRRALGLFIVGQWVDFVQESNARWTLYRIGSRTQSAVDFIQVVRSWVIHRIEGVGWTSCSNKIAAVDFMRFAEFPRCTSYRAG